MSNELTERFAEFEAEFNKLPNKTILEIVGAGKSSEIVNEKSIQRALFYFLDPQNNHELDNRFLLHFIGNLQNLVDFDEKFETNDLKDVQVSIEVETTGENISGNLKVDGLIWLNEKFFICIEMKTRSSETGSQTIEYEKSDKFNFVGAHNSLKKSSIPEENHHYIYLSKKKSSSPKSSRFRQISWDWVSDVLDRWIRKANNAKGYDCSNRVLLQIIILNQTIKKDLIDESNKEYQNKKVSMYFEYYDEILEVEEATDSV